MKKFLFFIAFIGITCTILIGIDSKQPITMPDSDRKSIQGEVLAIEKQSDGATITMMMHGRPCNFSCSLERLKSGMSRIEVGDNILVTYQEANGIYRIHTIEQIQDVSEKNIQQILSKMSIEEKVGQMFFIRCPQENVEETIKHYAVGGCLLFGRDFKGKTLEEIQKNILQYQQAAKIPLLIGVDEEGGTVNRVSRYPTLRKEPFLSPQELYTRGSFSLIQKDTEEKADFLHSFGINVNFAPVCDLSTNPKDYIYARTLGQSVEDTSKYVQTVVHTMREKHMGMVLKHFPGYGNNQNTHTGVVYDKRPYQQFIEQDFHPFQAGIQEGADCILVSHNIVECMDAQKPASLSRNVHCILREKLGFNGVILTDDLVMDAIQNFSDYNTAAVLAVQAGNDMLVCSDLRQIDTVVQAIKQKKLSEEQLNQSVLRILRWKQALQILSK